MSTVIFYDPTNTFLGFFLSNGSRAFKRDGREFEAQAKMYAVYCAGKGETVELIALPKGASHVDKRQFMLRKLRYFHLQRRTFDNFTFFGHGHKKALNRKMITYLNIKTVAQDLRSVLTGRGKITLFACNTAKAPSDGFAKRFAVLTGTAVVGHIGSGHVTRYPWKRMLNAVYKIHSNWWPSYAEGKKDLRVLLNSYPEAPFEYVDKQWEVIHNGM